MKLSTPDGTHENGLNIVALQPNSSIKIRGIFNLLTVCIIKLASA